MHLKTFPLGNLGSSYPSTFPSQPRSLNTSPRKMSARPGQTYVCINGTHREHQQLGGRRTQGQGWGLWHPIKPVTALRTLKPTLGFLSETRVVYEPSSSRPMPCPWQITQLATACQPMSWQRCQQGSTPSATCLLSLFIEYHCPSTGLCSQAPGFQSAFWEADRGQAGRGRLPCLTLTSSLPRA